jgi:hypothetical protein
MGNVTNGISTAINELTPAITTLATVTTLGLLGGVLAGMPAAALGVGVGIVISPLANRGIDAIRVGAGRISTGIHALFNKAAKWVKNSITYVKESLLGWNSRVAALPVTPAPTQANGANPRPVITNPFDLEFIDEEQPATASTVISPNTEFSTNPFDDNYREAHEDIKADSTSARVIEGSTNPFDDDYQEEADDKSKTSTPNNLIKRSTNPFDPDFVDDTEVYVEGVTPEKEEPLSETALLEEDDNDDDIFYETFQTFDEMDQTPETPKV